MSLPLALSLIILLLLALGAAFGWKYRTLLSNLRKVNELNRERFLACMSGVQDLVSEVDAQGRISFLNSHFERELGYSSAECLGRLPSDVGIIAPDEVNLHREALAKILAGEKTPPMEHRMQHRNGERVRYESRATLFGTPYGGVRIAVVSRCIEVERKTHEQLLQTIALQHLLVDNEAFGVALIRQGVFEWTNPKLAKMLGCPQRQLKGAPAVLTTGPGSTLLLPELAPPQPPLNEWYDRELELLGGDGLPFQARLMSKPIRPEDPAAGTLWLFEDVTTRHQTEVALRQSLKLESLGLLAGGLAHDFNNLLAAILGNLNLAQAKLPDNAPALDYLERVERTVLKASDLTRQMLAYSGRGQFVIRPHDLNQVVKEVARLLQASLPKKIGLHFRLAAQLPPFQGDAAQVQQVVMNLVTNAADAIGEHEGSITISTEELHLTQSFISTTFPTDHLRPGPYVVLGVEDTGCGMSRDIMNRIFDPFFTTKLTGRGLGLSAMLGILRGHHADIKIYSEEGRGSVFKVFFPASPEQLSPAPSIEDEIPEDFSGRILLVDDEAMILEITRTALEDMGFEVIEAVNGLEALEVFQQDPGAVDLVLMDLTMPRMDGKEAMDAMRRIRPDVPIILTSGYCNLDTIQSPLGQGQAAFIQKPYQIKDLRKLIHATLRG